MRSSTRTSRRAVNAPAVGTEQVRRLGPSSTWPPASGRVGRALAGNVQAVELRYAGESDDEALRPLTAAAMLGMLLDVVGRGGVNLVSALHLAEARGIRVSRVLLEPHPDFGERVELRIAGGGRRTRIAGRAAGRAPADHPHQCVPHRGPAPGACSSSSGTGTCPASSAGSAPCWASAAVNIGEYHQGRVEAGGEAMAAIAIDQKLSMEVLDALGGCPTSSMCTGGPRLTTPERTASHHPMGSGTCRHEPGFIPSLRRPERRMSGRGNEGFSAS
jgi:D-3-phosphoglycerate dehydrogenase / 2-oxoglutarate reductase